MVGRVVQRPNKFPGPKTFAANTVAEDLRKHITLCHTCEKFKPDQPGNCPIAEQLFQLGRKSCVGTIVSRCAEYVAKESNEPDRESHSQS